LPQKNQQAAIIQQQLPQLAQTIQGKSTITTHPTAQEKKVVP